MNDRKLPMYTRHEHEVILDYAEKRAKLLSNEHALYGAGVGFILGVACATGLIGFGIWIVG